MFQFPHQLRRVALLQLAVVGLLLGQSGCRALRAGGYTKDLSTARQLSLRGWDALEQSKLSDAETLFAEAIRQSPNDERAQWGFAEVLWHRGDQKGATAHMVQATELSGANPDLVVRLGQMYLDQKNYHQALQQADTALRARRDNAAAWALKGDVLRTLQDSTQAIDCYHRALIYKPDWPEVQVTVAELYQSMNRPERALATLDRLYDQRSIAHVPPRAQVLRGKALASLGEQNEARSCLRQAAHRLDSDQSELLCQIAELQLQLGDYVEARLCLSRSMEKDPNNPTALVVQRQLDESFQRLSSTVMPNAQPNWNR